MILERRYDQILRLLSENEYLTVDEVVEKLGISASTVRRDFRLLAKRNLVMQTRGGICQIKKEVEYGNLPYELRKIQNMQEKESLAKRAASLIRPNDTIFLDGGTTTLQLARFLPDFKLTIITNSLPHASTIVEKRSAGSQVEVFMAGGYVYAPWHLTFGPQSRYCISQYHAQIVFLSVMGIDENGLYNPNELLVETERTMIQNADKVVVIADHSKIGQRSMCHLCDLDQIHVLILMKESVNDSLLKKLNESKVEVIIVES